LNAINPQTVMINSMMMINPNLKIHPQYIK
jgi:hypothetical protein